MHVDGRQFFCIFSLSSRLNIMVSMEREIISPMKFIICWKLFQRSIWKILNYFFFFLLSQLYSMDTIYIYRKCSTISVAEIYIEFLNVNVTQTMGFPLKISLRRSIHLQCIYLSAYFHVKSRVDWGYLHQYYAQIFHTNRWIDEEKNCP